MECWGYSHVPPYLIFFFKCRVWGWTHVIRLKGFYPLSYLPGLTGDSKSYQVDNPYKCLAVEVHALFLWVWTQDFMAYETCRAGHFCLLWALGNSAWLASQISVGKGQVTVDQTAHKA